MERNSNHKHKVFNDPVYGFISIPDKIILELIDHPYLQRLRRIKQLGLTHLVYPGALHTRFHHAMGAMHLMSNALDVLKLKGHLITKEEELGALITILLHDIGHGPFSHALENSLVQQMNHESISELFMEKLNREFGGQLSLALQIFRNEYEKKFLHQLVSGQLDMDRMDYLKRDTFFTGVSEGVIGSERIIKMLNIVDDELVVEAKGIYSIEKFLIARRLMYWQVYLHKTVIAAEMMLMKVLQRAKYLSQNGEDLFASPALKLFLKMDYCEEDFKNNPDLLESFAKIDDFDIFTSIKVWRDHTDLILSFLSKSLVNRKLYKIELKEHKFDDNYISELKNRIKHEFCIQDNELDYFLICSETSNYAYKLDHARINILLKNGDIVDLVEASDVLKGYEFSKNVIKHFICYPKDI